MGIDVTYLAMPADFARELGLTGNELLELSFALRAPPSSHGPPPDDEVRYIHEEVAPRLREANPGIEQRRYEHSDRSWDALHWILSPVRRGAGKVASGDDVASAYVCGAEVLAGAFATQGWPMRQTPTERVRDVLAFAETLDEAALRRALEAHPFDSVYKVADGASLPESHVRALVETHERLRRLHAEIAQRGEALLVVFD